MISLPRTRIARCLAVALALAGCAMEATSPDGIDDVGITGGKADGSDFSDCELEAVRVFVSDPRTSVDALVGAGVHARAAWNIVAARERNGEFLRIQDVDDVSWVGPVAMRQLVAAAPSNCGAVPGDSAMDVIFSPTDEFRDSHAARIVQLINSAERSIDINIYSFSQSEIVEAVVANADRLRIRVLYDKGHLGRGLETRLENAGIEVRYVGQVNHHKYAIFDGVQAEGDDPAAATISTGSANWSPGAVDTYDESTVFVRNNPELALRYQQEFNLMWNHSYEVEGHDEIEYFETMEITDEMIAAVEDPTVDAIFTSSNFVVTSSGALQARKDGYDVADRWVEAIMNAEESIWLYQERLRSVPIANALLAKAAADPDIEIRVFMDNQEYEDPEDSAEMLQELEDCYQNARTTTQTFNCETGMKYSYIVAEQLDGNGDDIPDPNPNHELRISYYAVNWTHTFHQMHQKTMVVDGRWIFSGSYNASFNSEFQSFENVLIVDGQAHQDLLAAFTEELEALWSRGASDEEYESLMSDVTSSSQVPIRLLPPMSMNWHEVAGYRSAVGRACGWSQIGDLRNNAERAMYCYRD